MNTANKNTPKDPVKPEVIKNKDKSVITDNNKNELPVAIIEVKSIVDDELPKQSVLTTTSEIVITTPEVTKKDVPKPITKAQKAKVIYEEMINDPTNTRELILAKIKKELALTKAGALTYFYKFQRESGVIIEKGPTKLDKAKEVYKKMILEGYERKDIMAAFIEEAGLTPAGASTYFQNLKKAASK